MIRVTILLAAVLAVTFPALAQNQGQIVPNGPFTPGHAVRAQNAGGTVATDAGGASGSNKNGQGYLTEVGITNTGTPFCINDALINAAGGYHQLCLGASALGGGLISYNAYGGASPLALSYNINGATYSFPGTNNGNVVGPTSPTPSAGNLAQWNGGTAVKDAAPPLSLADAGPVWASYSGLHDTFRYAVNSYPTGAEFGQQALGGGTNLPVTQALVGAVDTPANDAGAGLNIANIGTSGYCRTAGKQCVGLFGGAAVSANLVSGQGVFGANTITSNGASLYPAENTGFDFTSANGIELDLAIVHNPGGVVPAGAVHGILMGGASTVIPTDGAFGVVIGGYGAGLKWTAGVLTNDGAVTDAFSIGSSATTPNSASQIITFHGIDGSAVDHFAQIFGDSNGYLGLRGEVSTGVNMYSGASLALAAAAPASAVNFLQITSAIAANSPGINAAGSDTNVTISLVPKGSGKVQFANSGSFSASGSVATVLGSIGPAGSHTTVQKWLTIIDDTGNAVYIPAF